MILLLGSFAVVSFVVTVVMNCNHASRVNNIKFKLNFPPHNDIDICRKAAKSISKSVI